MKKLVTTIALIVAIGMPLTASAQVTLLSGWNNDYNFDDDPASPFDQKGNPTFPTDQWFSPISNGSSPIAGTDVDLDISTTIGVTEGSSSFKITQDGSNRGGGDTHYNFTTSAYYTFVDIGPLAADPRGLELADAVRNQATLGGQVGNSMLVDITLDFENMVERDPSTDALLNWTEGSAFFAVGFHMGGRALSGGTNLTGTGFDWTTNSLVIGDPTGTFTHDGISYEGDLSDAPGSTPVAPLTLRDIEIQFPDAVSFKTNLWNILNNTLPENNAGGQAIELGFVINGNWALGTSQSVYIDNLRLVTDDRVADALERIDFNDNGVADLPDYETFLNDFLANVTGDGDIDGDGDSDLADLNQFETDYNFIQSFSGGATLAEALAGVPEPGSVFLVSLAALIAVASRRRKNLIVMLVLVPSVLVLAPSNVKAQIGTVTLLESWEDGTLDPFVQTSTTAQATIGVETQTFATEGSMVLSIQQQGEFNENDVDEFIGHTLGQYGVGSAQFDAIADAVSLGSELFSLKLDVIYNGIDDFDVDSIYVPLAIGSGAGFNRVGTTLAEGQGLWQSGDGDTVVTIDVPLSDFEPLGDSELGNSQYQFEIGLGGIQTPDLPFEVYFDNLRLEQTGEADLLELTVNRDNGSVILSNPSDATIDISYYEIRSENGGLTTATWNSLADQDGGPVGSGWDEVPASGETLLAEVRAQIEGQEPLSIGPGATLPLGAAFAGEFSDQEDLVFQYRTPGRPAKLIGGPEEAVDYLVTYTGSPLPERPAGLLGDFNDDGTVDAADYTVWRDNLTAANEDALNGNGDGMNGVDQADYVLWRTNFGNSSEPGSAAIPEPSTLIAAMLLCLPQLSSRRFGRQ